MTDIVETPADEVTLSDEERTTLLIKEIAASTLNTGIMSNGFFSICNLTMVAEMGGDGDDEETQQHVHSREYKILHTLHCVNYNTMTPAIKRNIPELMKIVLLPYIGELLISDKTHCGVRLFQTNYLPESLVPEEPEVVPAPVVPKRSRFDKLITLFRS